MSSHRRSRATTRSAATRSSLAACVGAAALAGAMPVRAQEMPAHQASYHVRLGAAVDVETAPTALRQAVTLRLCGVTVERALRDLLAQTRLPLLYSRAVVPLDRIVSVNVDRGSVLDALSQMLGDTGIELWVSSEGRMVLVPGERAVASADSSAASGGAVAVAGVVTGRVIDSASGRPLPNAQVGIVGTALGATTNDAGRFTIAGVTAGPHTVRVILIGFAPQTREVSVTDGQPTSVDFALRAQAVQLEAVVSVGYGTRSSREITGAVTAVSTEKLETLPVASIDHALAGQVPGVQVLQNNGIPGGAPQIQVRGVGAIGAGNEPLYVVDGFPLPTGSGTTRDPLADIKPDDIASITVLKDASSAAIYGSRAARGVVLITTKTGRSQPARITLNYATGVSAIPSNGLPKVMNAQEFAQFQKERIEDQVRFDSKREPTLADVPVDYQNPSQYGEGTNWLDEITRSAPTNDLNLSVSGGTSNIATYASGGYLRQSGTVIGTDFTRYSLRANVNADLSKRLRLGFNVAPSFSTRRLPVSGDNGRNEDGGIGQAASESPLVSPYAPEGSLVPMISSSGTIAFPNPLLVLQQLSNNFSNFRGLGTAFAEWQPVDGLRLRSSANVDVSDQRQTFFRPSTLGGVNAPPPRIPSGQYNTSTYTNWLTEQTATYARTVARDHHFDLLGGVSVQANKQSAGNFTGTNYADDGIQTLNAAPLITGNSDAQDWGLVSYVARLNYAYGEKYLLTLADRRDGSSRFAPDNRWGSFPSAAIGWRLSEEPFLKGVSHLDDLKLRGSWGRTGNNQIGNYAYVGGVGTNNYVLNNALAAGRGRSSFGNSDLGWEQTEEGNVGLDLSLFGNRVSFTGDYYRRDTKSLLVNVQVPQSSGYSSVTENAGKVRNQGVELAVHTVNVKRGSFLWSSDVNVAMNRNKVLALDASGAVIRSGTMESNPSNITQVGQPVGMFYGYIWDGLYADSADILKSGSFPGAIPGNVKYRDLNGDGQITAITDFTIIGNPYPDATFGINNSFGWKRFELSSIMSGQIGGDKMMQFRTYLDNIDGVFNVSEEIEDRWRSPTNPGNGRIPTTAGVARSRQLYRAQSTRLVHDASYLSIRNVTLRYSLPPRTLRGLTEGGSVFVSVQNAYVFTDYPGGNPEASSYVFENSPLTPGIDFSPYPVPRTVTLGVRVGF